MKEDSNATGTGQGLFVDSAESLREHLRGSVRQALKEIFEEEIRSSISRLWQRKATELVEKVQQSDLSGIDPVVLMLDGVVLSKRAVATVALGIDGRGTKHVLGFQVGSSENQEVCRDLLGNLSRRGLRPPKDRYLLGVLDGSKALENALLEVFLMRLFGSVPPRLRVREIFAKGKGRNWNCQPPGIPALFGAWTVSISRRRRQPRFTLREIDNPQHSAPHRLGRLASTLARITEIDIFRHSRCLKP